MKGVLKRLYDDFVRPPKYNEYERIIKAAKEAGYSFQTVLSFENCSTEANGGKVLIIRRDVDTKDIPCLRKFLEIEKRYGAKSTSYFRWNTLDIGLMKDIADAGGEASYHYEEIATFCYKHRIHSKEVMFDHLEEIRGLFILQLARFRDFTKQPCLTIASHGDYVNTKMATPNLIIIDERVRKNCGIVREAYDNEHIKRLTCRIADQVEGDMFTSKVIAAIERGEPVLEILIHPRQWNSPLIVNLKEEINRVCKGLYMRL